jgi:hypothetical protein
VRRSFILGIMEYAFEWLAKHGGDSEGGFQRRRVFSQLDGVHGLARHLYFFSELLLRHLAMLEAQSSDFVTNHAHVTHHAGIG